MAPGLVPPSGHPLLLPLAVVTWWAINRVSVDSTQLMFMSEARGSAVQCIFSSDITIHTYLGPCSLHSHFPMQKLYIYIIFFTPIMPVLAYLEIVYRLS